MLWGNFSQFRPRCVEKKTKIKSIKEFKITLKVKGKISNPRVGIGKRK